MEPTLEQLSPLEWQLSLPLDPAAIEAEVERRLGEMRPRAHVPGFRPGRAPLGAVRRHHGTRVREQQWERSAQAAVRKALAERGLWAASTPRLEAIDDGRGVSARFEVFPELPVIDVDRLKIRRPLVEIGENDVDAMIERLRRREGRDHGGRREELRASMAAELPEALAEEEALAVESALLEAHPAIELPAGLLAAQGDRLRQAGDGHGQSSPGALEREARRLLSVALLLAASARQLGVKPDPALLWEETERITAGAKEPQEELDRLWADGEAIQEIEDRLLRRRVVAAVLERAQVEELPMTFEELVARRQGRLEAAGAAR